MPYTSKIEETKHLGYEFVKAQGSIKLGIDTSYVEASKESGFDPLTYTKTYLSVNAENISPKNDGEEGDDIYPLDEEGAVNTGGTKKRVIEMDSFNMNKNNPVHIYLNQIDYDESLGLNIPVVLEDYASGYVEEGMANITIEAESAGGDNRKLTPVVTFIGKPTVTKIED